MIIQDQMHRELYFERHPQRIVSLVPSQTELLYDLGLEEQLVGVTKFCVHPAHIRKTKKVIGGTKSVHFDRIQELQPDVILCNKEENTREMVLELEKIAPVHVSDITGIEDSLELMQQYGRLFCKEEEASALISGIRKELKDFQKQTPKLKVAYFIWRKPWMLAGRDTFINTLLELNGWENVFRDPFSRYPETELKELAKEKPELVLLSSEPFPFKDKHIKEISEYLECPVVLVDGEYFSWYGSRLLPAVSYFREFQKEVVSLL